MIQGLLPPSQHYSMALFGLVWLLRVRGARCNCPACSNDKSPDSSREDEETFELTNISTEAADVELEGCSGYVENEKKKEKLPPSKEKLISFNGACSVEMYSDVRESVPGRNDMVYCKEYGERTMSLLAEACVNTVESEAEGHYSGSGQYETTVTCDATVQTDFEDEDFDYEAYGAASLEVYGPTPRIGHIANTAKIMDVETLLKENSFLKDRIKHLEKQVEYHLNRKHPEITTTRVSSMVQVGSDEELAKDLIYNPAADYEWQYLTVELDRGSSGLGFSIAGGTDGAGPHPGADQSIYITKLTDDGAATLDGRLRLNDAILQVNGVSVVGVPHAAAVEALKRAGNHVTLYIRRANPDRRSVPVVLEKGPRGLGFSIAGGKGSPHVPGDDGVFITQVSADGAAAGRLNVGDRIVAVRNTKIGDKSLIGVTHAEAVAALKAAGDTVELLVVPVSRENIYGGRQRSQATSCSALHELSCHDGDIPRGIRTIILRRSGSRLGMDIVGGEGGGWGVFVSGVAGGGSAQGRLYRGDQILAVDGADLTAASHEQAARALKGTGPVVTITAQFKPEEYRCLEAKIRELNMQILRDKIVGGGELTKSEENIYYGR